MDNAFTDLQRDIDGRAWVHLRPVDAGWEGGTRMWLDEAYTHLMVFTGDTLSEPARRRHGLAVEPMTCAPDALRSGDGRRVLEPGETITAAWGVEPGRQ